MAVDNGPDDLDLFRLFDMFALSLHRSLRIDEVLAVAVNDGRSIIGAERLIVAIIVNNCCTAMAISGQSKVVTRSVTVKQLERIAVDVVQSGESLLHTGEDDRSRGIGDALTRYLIDSKCRAFMALPLRVNSRHLAEKPVTSKLESDRTVGCLMLEQFSTAVINDDMQQRAALLADHVALAIENARRYQTIFLLPVLSGIGAAFRWFEGRRFWSAAAVLGGVALFVVGCFVIPWEYRVTAKGKLLPVSRANLYAPWDGNVSRIYVKDGDAVKRGQAIMQLASSDLDAKLVSVETEVARKQELLSALESQLDAARINQSDEYATLQGEIKQAEVEVAGAISQLDMLNTRRASLALSAPINGVVATFQVDQMLSNRPVKRGEQLLYIVDPVGEWQVELAIPENRLGHVLGALQSSGGALPVQFRTSTDLSVEQNGKLQHVATRVDESETTGTQVQAIVRFDSSNVKLQNRHVGAEVSSKILCGPRSLGYVLFGDLIEFFAKRIWL